MPRRWYSAGMTAASGCLGAGGETAGAQLQRMSRQDRLDLARHTTMLLNGLGRDPAAIAGSLAAAGVQGEPADARQCALAMYLRAVMAADPRVTSVRVFHDRVVVGVPGNGVRRRRVPVAMAPALRAFVSGFDAQRYPMLVRGLSHRSCSGIGPAPAPASLPAPAPPQSRAR